jgi:hypothetical protein
VVDAKDNESLFGFDIDEEQKKNKLKNVHADNLTGMNSSSALKIQDRVFVPSQQSFNTTPNLPLQKGKKEKFSG